MPQSRTTLALLASLALVLGSAAGAGAAPKPKPPPPEPAGGMLVALGDSFSAGTGTYDRDDLACYRSMDYAYPVLLADRLGYELNFQACEGATTSDVLDNQLGTLADTTAMVTMTVGGNDVGFADVLSECALPGWLSNCSGAIAAGQWILDNQLGGRLDSLYSTIASKVPPTAVTVGGYPHLFNEISDCSWTTYFDKGEMVKLNDATDDLNALVLGESTKAGFRYVDPQPAFDGHAVCDSSPYINGYSSPIGESYHPNRAGNVAYADVFAPAGGDSGGGGGKGGGKPRTTTRTMSIDAQADYVADLGLDSPESLARAEAAGLDRREIRGLVAQLRSGNETAQLAALKRLQVLDERVASARG